MKLRRMPEPILACRLSLYGPGRAGRALLRSWRAAGGAIGDVLGRDPAAVSRVRVELGLPPASGAAALETADVLFVLAVPDDAIVPVAASLRAVPCRYAFHLSGALPAAALAPLSRPGVSLGSLHPLRVFSGGPGETWEGAFVAVEGEPAAVEAGLAAADALGARGRRLGASGKALYHAGAQLAAGGTAALISLASRAWSSAGLDREDARRELSALAGSAVAAAAAKPFDEAFTGAIARRDVATIRAHVEALASDPDVLAVYRALAAETLARTPGRGREAEVRALLGC
jgi:predicted short-subunit dehydrogenase-like oxidoreductase (DUF2520 family)